MLQRLLRHHGALVFAMLLFTLVFSRALSAQSDAGAGALRGEINEADGKAAANATVTVRNAETGYVRELQSNARGEFDAQALPVGRYFVQAVLGEFKSDEVEAIVTVGRTHTMALALKASNQDAGTKEVTVQTQTMVMTTDSPIDTHDVSSSSSVYLRSILTAPIRGRSFPDFVQLTPDIYQESDRNGLVISGQRSINSYVALDGADFNDPLQGNQRGGNDPVFFFPLAAVREFQVVRSGLDAEVGRTNAGFVNAVTKSGTNDWHGEGFYMNRNSDLTSPDAFGNPAMTMQHQFGGALGGHIKKDRTFFFVAAEQNFLTLPFVVQFQPQPAGVTLPASLASLQGDKEGTNNTTSAFARLDHSLTSKHMLNLDLLYVNLDAKNFALSPRTNDTAESTNFDRQGSSAAVKASLVSALNSAWLNELRGQFATDYRFEQPNAASSMIVITGVGTLGTEVTHPRLFDNKRYEATDNVSVTTGGHSIRFGVDSNVTPSRQQREQLMAGRYDFKSLADFNAGKIARYRGVVATNGDPNSLIYDASQQELGLFIQDKFRLARNLMVNAGFRWDGQWNPQPPNPNPAFPQTQHIPNDLKMWQPRLGLAWDPKGHGTTVIRASAGLYDARTPANLFQRMFTDNNLTTATLDSKFDKTVLNFVKFPNTLAFLPAGVKPAPNKVVGFSPSFENPRSFQASASVETAIGETWAISGGYTRNSTWSLQRRLDQNLFPATFDVTGMPIFPTVRPKPSIGPLSINESEAHSRYDAFDFTVNKRMSHHLQFQAGYTLAWNRDNESGERVFNREDALDPLLPELDAGPSKNDIRHNLRLSGILDLPHGFTVSAITMNRSAAPFTPTIGFDTQNDGNDDNDRAIINGHVAGRNSMRGAPFSDLDMRILKSFRTGERSRLETFAEFFNVTHNANRYYGPDSVSLFGTPTAPNPTAGQALFAPLTTRFGGPRQVQMGARFSF
ncbi:MAG TPA: carboxypeptidase regulatory-like domain-containing protein [Candidatus Angelobacter sp.]|nr:carboxypeptidase regulatory-like domain-containing protein [Candidatus Angelobacter sp.]